MRGRRYFIGLDMRVLVRNLGLYWVFVYIYKCVVIMFLKTFGGNEDLYSYKVKYRILFNLEVFFFVRRVGLVFVRFEFSNIGGIFCEGLVRRILFLIFNVGNLFFLLLLMIFYNFKFIII